MADDNARGIAPNHSVGRASRSYKAHLRDRAEARGIRSYNGKPFSRLTVRELEQAIGAAAASGETPTEDATNAD